VEERNYGGSPEQSRWDERLVEQLGQQWVERLVEQLRQERPERIVWKPRLVGRLARFERLEQSERLRQWLEQQQRRLEWFQGIESRQLEQLTEQLAEQPHRSRQSERRRHW
jgi:hypothetical protein